MTRRLVLLRHGRTAWNEVERAQGHTDVPLDEQGHAQAAAVAPVIAAMRPALLTSSDLRRACATASYVAAATGLVVVPDPRLRENDVGERAGLTPTEFEAAFPAEYAAWMAGEDAPCVPGAETQRQMVDRSAPALLDLLDALGPDETGVAVLHGWCAKAVLGALLGWPVDIGRSVRGMDNCAFAVLGDDGPDRRLRLHSYNQRV